MTRRLADVPPDARAVPYRTWLAKLPASAFYDAAELAAFHRQAAAAEKATEQQQNDRRTQRKRRAS